MHQAITRSPNITASKIFQEAVVALAPHMPPHTSNLAAGGSPRRNRVPIPPAATSDHIAFIEISFRVFSASFHGSECKRNMNY